MTDEKKYGIPEMTAEKDPSSLKLVLALAVAGLLSGIILVGTYIYADPIIEANKAAAVQRAIFKVLPDCNSFTTLILTDGKLSERRDGEETKEGTGKEDLLVYAGFNSQQELIGFAIPGSESGFQDIIAGLIGYDASKHAIIGFEVLESKETPGLGDKIMKDAAFQANFTALATDPEIIPVKKGEKHNPNEVETITGATISSKAVVRLLNNTMNAWQDAIQTYIMENNLNVAYH